jgi:hypothetical protein
MRLIAVATLSLIMSCAASTSTEMRECAPGECSAEPGKDSPEVSAVRRRAAFDLRCDEAKVRVVAFDARTFGADGCGLRATYTNSCADRWRQDPLDEGRCTWVQTAPPNAGSPPSSK